MAGDTCLTCNTHKLAHRALLGESLFGKQGKHHKIARHAVASAFTPTAISSYLPGIHASLLRATLHIAQSSQGSPIRVRVRTTVLFGAAVLAHSIPGTVYSCLMP